MARAWDWAAEEAICTVSIEEAFLVEEEDDCVCDIDVVDIFDSVLDEEAICDDDEAICDDEDSKCADDEAICDEEDSILDVDDSIVDDSM